jgi:hypothetical protein
MVLTKPELITSLQNEVRILLHLATKIDRTSLDYRPAPKQRSTIELLRYLAVMGPALVKMTKAGAFDPTIWQEMEKEVTGADLDKTLAVIARHSDDYAKLLNGFSDAELRESISMFGRPAESKGSFLVNLVLSGCAAYRTQIFLYLKACGREELGTANLWGGVDAPAAAV